jgi:hypothetical protein
MTNPQRRQLLDKLARMATEDYGPPNDDGINSTFCPHCAIWRAIDMLEDVYEDVEMENLDDIAQRVIDERDKGDPDIENVVTIH